MRFSTRAASQMLICHRSGWVSHCLRSQFSGSHGDVKVHVSASHFMQVNLFVTVRNNRWTTKHGYPSDLFWLILKLFQVHH